MAKRGPLRLRNDEHGYGLVTKSLHWTVVAAMAAQFAVGWTMDAGGHGRGRGRGRLPPWAPTLSPCERTLAHWNERLLYLCMFAVPLSGLAIVAAGDDDLVALHVATHVVFWVALAGHVGLVLAHQLLHRDRLLRRMT